MRVGRIGLPTQVWKTRIIPFNYTRFRGHFNIKTPYSKLLFLVIFIRWSKLSRVESLFLWILPHFWHFWTTRHSPAFSSVPTGSIKPQQSFARSPGKSSTCLLQRQCGQWLVYPSPSTFSPQCSQLKSSFVRLNSCDICYFNASIPGSVPSARKSSMAPQPTEGQHIFTSLMTALFSASVTTPSTITFVPPPCPLRRLSLLRLIRRVSWPKKECRFCSHFHNYREVRSRV